MTTTPMPWSGVVALVVGTVSPPLMIYRVSLRPEPVAPPDGQGVYSPRVSAFLRGE